MPCEKTASVSVRQNKLSTEVLTHVVRCGKTEIETEIIRMYKYKPKVKQHTGSV